MTGLRRWRKVAKNLIILSLTWEAAAAIASLIFLTLAVVIGGEAPSADRVIEVVGTLGMVGVVSWAIGDAWRRTRRQPLERVAKADDQV